VPGLVRVVLDPDQVEAQLVGCGGDLQHIGRSGGVGRRENSEPQRMPVVGHERLLPVGQGLDAG
jgi:hypothetical protein